MSVVVSGINKTFTVADQTVVNVRREIFSLWVHWVKASDNAKFLQAIRPVGGDSIGDGGESPNFFFLMNNWKVVVDGVDCTFQYNLYCEKKSNDNFVPFLYINGGNSTNETSSSPIVVIEGGTLTAAQDAKLMNIPTADEVAATLMDMDVTCL